MGEKNTFVLLIILSIGTNNFWEEIFFTNGDCVVVCDIT
jgi:hypothetical protein